jgi:hypothetical protein
LRAGGGDPVDSSSAHIDWELAVGVRQCPLRSGAGKGARRGGSMEDGGGRRRALI